MLSEVTQEGDDPVGANILVGAQGEQQMDFASSWQHGQNSDDRGLLAGVAALEKHRRASSGRPGPTHPGGGQESELVDEDEPGAAPCGLLARGQRARTQPWMCCSSLSHALRIGFWGVQLRERRSEPSDVVDAIGDVKLAPNQRRHPWLGPRIGVVAPDEWSFEQPLLELWSVFD